MTASATTKVQITADETADLRAWCAVAGGVMAAFMATIDVQITNSALANIEGTISATPSEGSWITTAYLIAETLTMPLTGWLITVFGIRRYLGAGSLLFILCSVACAAATSLPQLIICRAAQGLFGGALVPSALTIVALRLPRRQQPIGVACFGLTMTMAPALGPTLGGYLAENWGWPFIFFINIGPGIVAFALQRFGLASERAHYAELKKGDWSGIFFMSVGLACLTVVLEEGQRLEWFESPLISALTVIAVAGLVSFAIRELVARRPFINLRLLGGRTVGGACLLITLFGGNLFGMLYLIPSYLAQVHAYNAQQIGSVLVWNALPQIILYPATAALMKFIDARVMLVVGVLCYATSCFLNAHISRLVGLDQLILPQVLSACGQPLFGVTLQYYSIVGLGARDAADSSALWVVCRNLGGAMGVALLSTVVQAREQFHFSVLAERITQNALATRSAIDAAASGVGNMLLDPARAQLSAIGRIAHQVRLEAFIMAYGDSFFLLGVSTVAGAVGIFLLPRSRGAVASTAMH